MVYLLVHRPFWDVGLSPDTNTNTNKIPQVPLTDAKIRSLKAADRPTKHADGGGLFVMMTPNGSRLWRLSYRFGGKQKTLALGSYPAVSLADARLQRDHAKALLARQVDPSVQGKLEKIRLADDRSNTFGAIANELLAKNEREGLAVATLRKKRWLIGMAYDDLGERPIREISAAEVLTVLRKIEAKGVYETARRLRAVIGQVFRFAVATARAESDPTGALRGALTTPTVTHQAAITNEDEFAGLIRSVWSYEGSSHTRTALKLMALLYPRPGELRAAEWSEFDREACVWTIPAARSKMRREHRKPLPALAVDLLQELQQATGNGRFVFPAIHTVLRPMSENTLNTALRRLGYSKGEMTSHGFRASASSLLNQSGLWNPDAVEAELGHLGTDDVRRAYHRAVYWDERVRMADWWAERLNALAVIAP